MRDDLPHAVLFACTHNAIRSPMAEAILKHLHGRRIYVDSVGLRRAEIHPFTLLVMDEIGLDVSRHRAKTFDDLEDSSFELIVTLSPEAHHRALELTRVMAVEVEFWHTFDPTFVEGSREAQIDAFRQVRDDLMRRIVARFPPQPKP